MYINVVFIFLKNLIVFHKSEKCEYRKNVKGRKHLYKEQFFLLKCTFFKRYMQNIGCCIMLLDWNETVEDKQYFNSALEA